MSSPPPAGAMLAHYRLIELLGEGAMGEVWRAEDSQLPRQVAVKLLPRHLVGDRKAMDRLLREARSAASVDHPNVVTVYEVGIEGDRPFIAMQLVEGETLEARLARGPIPVSEAVTLALAVADALAEVHALGIVHRDLKPSNLMLSQHGPKILDFGVASAKDAGHATGTAILVGTPYTMSPEQLRGAPADNRSDLWALGAILYLAITGERPFEGDSLEALAYQVLNRDPPPPGARRSEVGHDLDFMVMKLLRKNPVHRYARAEDLIADLVSCRDCESPRSADAPAGSAVPRLAVLYFEVLSGDPEDTFLAAGLTEDLIVDLTRVAGLRVSSRAEVMPFRDRPVPARTLGRELAADYVLQGSVRRLGRRARISAQLVRALDGHSIWAERFDRTLEDLFDVQAEVSRRIVDALEVKLHPGEREMLDRAPTSSPVAYELYLRARELLDQRYREANFQAEEVLQRALELDPGFALAHAALGECHARRGLSWWAGLEAADAALACAQRALEFEPDLTEAHLAVAMSGRLCGDHARLAGAVEEVLRRDPDHAEAQELLAWGELGRGRPERALPVLDRIIDRWPEHILAAAWRAQCLRMLGRDDELPAALALSRERLVEVLRKHPENVHARSLLAGELVLTGEREAAIEHMERTIAMAPTDGRVRYNAACMFARAGLTERAIAELREGIGNLPNYIADWPRRDPDLASLHEHPEFVRLFGRA